MIDILSNHLQATLLETGKVSLQLTHVDLASLVEKAIQQHYLTGKLKGLTFKLNVQARPFIKADPNRILELLDQLIHNAVKFSPHNEPIHVRIFAMGNYGCLSITNQGKGFLPSQSEKLFRKYVRISPSVEWATHSSGLGLMICRKIVELHNGKIWASSKGLQAGATFGVEVPLARCA